MLRTKKIAPLTNESTEDEIVAVIHSVKQFPRCRRQLLPYLRRQHPLYRGRSANEVVRIRGFLLASFAHTGLTGAALPFVLEELETGRHAYLVAGAAIALRGLPAPDPAVVPYLLKAIRNMQFRDDALSLESCKPQWPLKEYTTALAELLKTLQWMGGHAREAAAFLKALAGDVHISSRVKPEIRKTIAAIEQDERTADKPCCDIFAFQGSPYVRHRKRLFAQAAGALLEDQDGRTIEYKDYFSGKPSVVVFFYTRCDNPNKCSLTVTRLGQLQKALTAEGLQDKVKTAAVTYDPVYDQPFRTRSYCENRGVTFNDGHRAFRVTSGMQAVLEYFECGVNYIGSVVNQHTTELFIVGGDGKVKRRFARLQWNVPDVVARLKKLLHKEQKIKTGPAPVKSRMSGLFSALLSFFVVFFPKCPLCWAAYLSILGITNIGVLRFTHWLLPVFVLLLFINLFSLYRGARRRNGFLPFYMSLSGILCIVFPGLILHMKMGSYLGLCLILPGAMLNSLSHSVFVRLRLALSRMRAGVYFNSSTS